MTTRDIADAIEADGFSVNRTQVDLQQPIKSIGLHTVRIVLHPEVVVSVTLNVARSADEAERQARGESLNQRDRDSGFEFEPEEDEGEGDDRGESAEA